MLVLPTRPDVQCPFLSHFSSSLTGDKIEIVHEQALTNEEKSSSLNSTVLHERLQMYIRQRLLSSCTFKSDQSSRVGRSGLSKTIRISRVIYSLNVWD